MKSNHDCISKVRANLKAQSPDIGWIRFDLSTIVSSSDESPQINKTGQRIEYSITKKKRDGTVVQKTEKSFVTHDYCPFCGEKYP